MATKAAAGPDHALRAEPARSGARRNRAGASVQRAGAAAPGRGRTPEPGPCLAGGDLAHAAAGRTNARQRQPMSNLVNRIDNFQRRHKFLGFPIAVVYKYFDDLAPALFFQLTMAMIM